jgi:hypothetical protein
LPDPPRRRLTAIATGLVVAALFAVDLAELPTRLDVESQRLPSGEQGAVWQDLETAAAWLSVQTDPSARVLAGPAPSLSLLSGRDVYTYRFARRPGLIDRYQVRYGVLFPWTPAPLAEQLRGRAVRRERLASRARPGAAIEMLEFRTKGRAAGVGRPDQPPRR